MQRHTLQERHSGHQIQGPERKRSTAVDGAGGHQILSTRRAKTGAATNGLLDEVGLGYLRLGQSATTLSGGEAQRVKLAAHLAQSTNSGTLFICDEPTTGLHFDDIKKLLGAFERLIDNGGSLLVIEHNLDVIQAADWVIDMGPEGGEGGGRIVAEGTPEQIAEDRDSYTGRFLGVKRGQTPF